MPKLTHHTALRRAAELLPHIVDPTNTGMLPTGRHVHAALLAAVRELAPNIDQLDAHAVIDACGRGIVAHLLTLELIGRRSVEPTWNRVGHGVRGMGVHETVELLTTVADVYELADRAA